jgi:hypothetical protein
MVPWTYPLIIFAAIATGLFVSRRTQRTLPMEDWQRIGVAVGAFVGAMLGAKLPFVLSDWQELLNGRAWFADGKTILTGLAGGYLGVVVAKWSLGIHTRTGDSFAVPVAASVAVGRLGCFVAGCCYGTPTSLPWGVVFAQHDVPIAIEHVVGAERNHVSAGKHVVNAALHHAADVEVVGIEERRNRDAKHVGRRKVFSERPAEELIGRLLQAITARRAAELNQLRRGACLLPCPVRIAATVSTGAAAEAAEVLLDELPCPRAVERDAVGQDVEMVFRVDEPRERHDAVLRAVGIAQCVTIGMRARQRHEVGRLE